MKDFILKIVENAHSEKKGKFILTKILSSYEQIIDDFFAFAKKFNKRDFFVVVVDVFACVTRFLKKYLTLICINWVPGDRRTIFLVTSFTRKMPESADSMYSSIFMLENI